MFEIVVRAIIKDKKGNLLLAKRVKSPEKDKWALTGGKVNEYEKAEDAIVREIKEELQILFSPHFFAYAESFEPERNNHCLVLYFTGNYTGKLKHKPDEISEIQFFSKEEIQKRENIAWNHKAILLKYLKS